MNNILFVIASFSILQKSFSILTLSSDILVVHPSFKSNNHTCYSIIQVIHKYFELY